MSTNYNKFFNNNQVDKEPANDEVVTETVEETISTDDIEETIITESETIEESVEETEVLGEKPKLLYGINNTKKLNIRTEPTKDGSIVCVLDSRSTFEIEELESDPEWVKVFLDNGKVGFCMKMYVAIK